MAWCLVKYRDFAFYILPQCESGKPYFPVSEMKYSTLSLRQRGLYLRQRCLWVDKTWTRLRMRLEETPAHSQWVKSNSKVAAKFFALLVTTHHRSVSSVQYDSQRCKLSVFLYLPPPTKKFKIESTRGILATIQFRIFYLPVSCV
jgi:hypothetical protein